MMKSMMHPKTVLTLRTVTVMLFIAFQLAEAAQRGQATRFPPGQDQDSPSARGLRRHRRMMFFANTRRAWGKKFDESSLGKKWHGSGTRKVLKTFQSWAGDRRPTWSLSDKEKVQRYYKWHKSGENDKAETFRSKQTPSMQKQMHACYLPTLKRSSNAKRSTGFGKSITGRSISNWAKDNRKEIEKKMRRDNKAREKQMRRNKKLSDRNAMSSGRSSRKPSFPQPSPISPPITVNNNKKQPLISEKGRHSRSFSDTRSSKRRPTTVPHRARTHSAPPTPNRHNEWYNNEWYKEYARRPVVRCFQLKPLADGESRQQLQKDDLVSVVTPIKPGTIVRFKNDLEEIKISELLHDGKYVRLKGRVGMYPMTLLEVPSQYQYVQYVVEEKSSSGYYKLRSICKKKGTFEYRTCHRNELLFTCTVSCRYHKPMDYENRRLAGVSFPMRRLLGRFKRQ